MTMTFLPKNPKLEKRIEKMTEMVPETDSEYASAPMMTMGKWRKPSDTTEDGQPCFIMYYGELSGIHDIPTKTDYIWIPSGVHKELLAGYYHLSTKEANCEVLRRVLLKDNERRASARANALKLKFRSKDQKEDDKMSKKVVRMLERRIKSASSLQTESSTKQNKKLSIATQRSSTASAIELFSI